MGGQTLLYVYMLVIFLVALRLVYKSKSEYKFELLAIAFFLGSGGYSDLLKFKLPGISFFEIQPDRFLLLTFLFLLGRRLLFPPERKEGERPQGLPWFKLMFNLFVIAVACSLIWHAPTLGLGEVIDTLQQPITCLLVIYGLNLMADKETVVTLGKIVITAAIISSIICVVQIIDADFMRLGERRVAFGSVLRSSGIFKNERTNAYFTIMAMIWVLTLVRENKQLRYLLIAIMAVGVVCTFHRMSWLVMAMVLIIYFTFIEKIGFHYLFSIGLAGATALLGVFIFAFDDIMESSVVKERLADDVDGRKGYYAMVFDNIGEKPLFGYGSKQNDAYFEGMMQVTRNRERALGLEGGLHSGYFSALFYYGVPAFVFFTAYIILGIIYFARLISYNLFFAIPFLLALLYAIGNLSNTLMFSKVELIYMIHIGLALGLRRMEEYIPLKTGKENKLIHEYLDAPKV